MCTVCIIQSLHLSSEWIVRWCRELMGKDTYLLLLSAGLLKEALEADATPLSEPVADEVAPAETTVQVQWDASTRCYAPDMYRAETVSP